MIIKEIRNNYIFAGQAVRRSSDNVAKDTKCLPFMSIAVCRTGGYLFEIKGKDPVSVGPGEAVLIGSDVEHSVTHLFNERNEMWHQWLFFDARVNYSYKLDRLFEFPNKLPACILPDLLSLIERAIGLSQENTITATVRRSAMMFSLLDLLVPYAVPVSNFSDELKGTLDYIEENFCHDIRLNDLLRLAPCSKSSFFQKFYSMTGCSPIHYIENRKLEHAALLLISTKMTISEIASAVGFGDPLYFSKRFKHKYKAPPRIYREKVLTQDATL